MTLEEIRELIKVVTETGVAELEVQRGDNRVRIRRVLRPQIHSLGGSMHASAPTEAVPTLAVAATESATPAPAAEPERAPADPLSDPSLIIVKSPIVGTFYESPTPGSAAFIRVGDIVRPGDVLCIIESMKLMNEIESEHSGTIVARFVQNSQAVEYGEALFAIRPA
ncbi:MAG TPA: acetyl-CoA carboxylase biotin carboxyl carrier protein [Bryobacteraceae bacterium]|nr:acetyl-CoA carboxylase biotin carboxyl carrier protein [Bryobacteraceae bacterium]